MIRNIHWKKLLLLLVAVAVATLAFAQDGGVSLDTSLTQAIKTHIDSGNYALLFFFLLLGGLAINLTPCVYPMIPITLAFFSNQAGDNRAARLWLGFTYMIGIAGSYGLLGGVAATSGAAFGALFTKAWFMYSLAFVMFGLALSMFDLYQIGIPPFIAKHLKGRSGTVGALIMGLLVGVAAAPCAGPLIVAVFSIIAKLNQPVLGIMIFIMVGVGLGLPYFALAAFAQGAKALPKAGGWMKTVKAVLGFVVIGVGLTYLLVALPKNLTSGKEHLYWAYFLMIVALYFAFGERKESTRSQVAIKGLVILLCGVYVGMGLEQQKQKEFQAALGSNSQLPTKVQWIKFDQESFAKAKASGKPILVDVWADWCHVCQTIDAKVFAKPVTIKALQDIITMKIDWSTGTSEEYMDYTQELFGMPGPPYFIFMKPGGEIVDKITHLKSPEDLFNRLKKTGAKIE